MGNLMETLEDETNSVRFVAYALSNNEWMTASEVASEIAMPVETASRAVKRLSELGVVLEKNTNMREPGRTPTAYRLPEGHHLDEENDTREEEVILALARLHYIDGLDSAKTPRIADRTSYTHSQLLLTINEMQKDGPIEEVGGMGRTPRYRLVPPGEWSPFFGDT